MRLDKQYNKLQGNKNLLFVGSRNVSNLNTVEGKILPNLKKLTITTLESIQ